MAFTGAGDRFQKNLAALRLVHTLEAEGRPATDAERLTLAHYTAFGESALLNLWLQVTPPAGELATLLSAHMTALLPSQVIVAYTPEERDTAVTQRELPPLHERRAQQIAMPALSGVAQERATGLATIYNTAKALIRAELNDAPDVDAARSELNRVYEQFIFQYGVIHDPRNQKLFGDLPELQLLLALERNPRRTPSGRWRADRERIFRERTLRPRKMRCPARSTRRKPCCAASTSAADSTSRTSPTLPANHPTP